MTQFIKTSFVDFEPYVSCTIFTKGCNMNCPYCHNRDMMHVTDLIPEKHVLMYLEKRKGIIDGVVLSGGEPTLQKDLISFISRIKKMGYKVKLDTNGSNPRVLKELLMNKDVDHVAMDIKGLSKSYKRLCGLNYNQVEESIELVKRFPTYEFRTTLYPALSVSEIHQLCKDFSREPYVLQQYRPNSKDALEPYDPEFLYQLKGTYGIILRGL